MPFLIRCTGSWYVFSKCLRARAIYPLASLSSPIHGHIHLPQTTGRVSGSLCCCWLCRDGSRRPGRWRWAGEAALRVPADSTSAAPQGLVLVSLLKTLQNSSLCFEWIKFDATHRGRNYSQYHRVAPCEGIAGLAEATGRKESISVRSRRSHNNWDFYTAAFREILHLQVAENNGVI